MRIVKAGYTPISAKDEHGAVLLSAHHVLTSQPLRRTCHLAGLTGSRWRSRARLNRLLVGGLNSFCTNGKLIPVGPVERRQEIICGSSRLPQARTDAGRPERGDL
jgi:hypothetical protein